MTSQTKTKLALFTALIAPAMLATPAMAQETLDEIIVTATKRAENAQDVPVSISTMDDEELKNIFQGGEDIRALGTRIPGLYAESSNGRIAPRFYIRGLGNTDFDLAASQPVSIVMDDVVQENVVLKSFPIFDVDRVEVLRGPQGSLFGRNTPAGLVKFDSVKPTEELTGYGTVSYGSFGSHKVEGAVGGTLVPGLVTARASVLWAGRDDFISNGFTHQKDVYGGFNDLAGRLQLMVTPTENFDMLFNVHSRSLNGTSALFRANILGTDGLNENFDRDRVYLDGGNGNNQRYDSTGASLKMNWDAGAVTFTSITGYEEADGTSRGDIDGGSGAVFLPGGSFPGFIPFPSDTLDGIDSTSQFTQELRAASNGTGPWKWQAGFYYFDSDLQVTTNPFFVTPSTVRHDNRAWSVFGQASYDFTDRMTLTGGLRYTDDQKEFTALASPVPVADVAVEDDQISWDASLNYKATDDVNLFVRAARGFRAPTIQGRDVAFFGQPSTADSETIRSFEVGFKSDLVEDRLRWNGTAYFYKANDLQFSAIGGGGNFNQLVNADGEGKGFETDIEFLPLDNLLIKAGLAVTDTEITEPNLRVVPCGANCTVTDPVDANGTALITGNPFPQAPEFTLNFSARYGVPFRGGEIYGMTDWAVQGETNFFLYESVEFNSNGNTEGGARLGYEFGDGNYDVSVFVRNILDSENVKGGIDFNNLTGFVNEPRIVGVAATGRF